MDKEIPRDYYLEQLIKRKDNGLIKIVTGIKRCGKSYFPENPLYALLRQIILQRQLLR